MKRCSKCGVEKPLDDFHTHAGCRDGRRPECKECCRAAQRARRVVNREADRQRDRERYAKNPVRAASVKAAAKRRYQANAETIIARARVAYELNRDAICAQRREIRAADPEGSRAKQRAYIAANRDAVNERRRLYRERNREAFIAKYREQYGDYAETYKRNAAKRRALLLSVYVEDVPFDEILQRDLGMCGICGKPTMETTIELDHIVPLAAGGCHERKNVQLAHRTCNRRKSAKVNFTLADAA